MGTSLPHSRILTAKPEHCGGQTTIKRKKTREGEKTLINSLSGMFRRDTTRSEIHQRCAMSEDRAKEVNFKRAGLRRGTEVKEQRRGQGQGKACKRGQGRPGKEGVIRGSRALKRAELRRRSVRKAGLRRRSTLWRKEPGRGTVRKAVLIRGGGGEIQRPEGIWGSTGEEGVQRLGCSPKAHKPLAHPCLRPPLPPADARAVRYLARSLAQSRPFGLAAPVSNKECSVRESA